MSRFVQPDVRPVDVERVFENARQLKDDLPVNWVREFEDAENADERPTLLRLDWDLVLSVLHLIYKHHRLAPRPGELPEARMAHIIARRARL